MSKKRKNRHNMTNYNQTNDQSTNQHLDNTIDVDNILSRITDLKQDLERIESNNEYIFYKTTSNELVEIRENRLDQIIHLIQKANILFEQLIIDLTSIIANSNLFEKNFDVLCLFKSPDQSTEAKDWFDSLHRALELMDKAAKKEVDNGLGRIPPSNFRACIKSSSLFDPVYTISVSTPIYRVKTGACSEEFFPIAQKGANSFTMHTKYILNAEQKLKTTLLKVLSDSDEIKGINQLCILPVVNGGDNPIERMRKIRSCIETLEEHISIEDYECVDLVDVFDAEIHQFLDSLPELNNILYNAKDSLLNKVVSIEKNFYKTSLSDVFKLYNDISKMCISFEKTDLSMSENEESLRWQNILIDIKCKIIKYLNELGIYENETVKENETIWNDSMDFIDIIEGEEDNDKPEGQISKINSIGFYYLVHEEKKYIEKTKVFVYRRG